MNVKFDLVHRSSHNGSSKHLKKPTTHICPKITHTSKDLLTCCINLTHMFYCHRWLWWCRRCEPTAGLLGSIRAPYRRAQDFELNLLNQYFKRGSSKDRDSPYFPPAPQYTQFWQLFNFSPNKNFTFAICRTVSTLILIVEFLSIMTMIMIAICIFMAVEHHIHMRASGAFDPLLHIC